MSPFELTGWIELDGKRLSPEEIERILYRKSRSQFSDSAGNFFLHGTGAVQGTISA